MQGPYTLEQINANLAARNYRDDAFWAWHEGLPAWVPLYSVGGVSGAADTTFFFARLTTEISKAAAAAPEPPGSDTAVFLAKPPWLHALQQVAEAKASETPVQPELENIVSTSSTNPGKQSQAHGEPLAPEAAVCGAPTPAAAEPAQELKPPAAASRAPSAPSEPSTPVDLKVPQLIAPRAAKARSKRSLAPAALRLTTPQAPARRSAGKSGRPPQTRKLAPTSTKRIQIRAGNALRNGKARSLTIKQPAIAAGPEPTRKPRNTRQDPRRSLRQGRHYAPASRIRTSRLSTAALPGGVTHKIDRQAVDL